MKMKALITQSKEWQKLQNDLGEKSFFEREKNYQYLAILKSTPVGNYLYLPYGPVCNDETGFKQALKKITSQAKENNAFFIRIEPTSEEAVKLFPKNAKKSTDLNPKETWMLDLGGEEKDLREKLPSRLLRYYRNTEKNGLKIEVSKNPEDIKYLLKLQRELADKKGINTFSENYLKTELKQPFASLYLVKYDNPETNKEEIVASGLVFDDKTTRYNLQGAQNDAGRKLHATGILTIKLILDAKKEGKKYFDFWGIAPENAPKNHPWAGFTNFKKTFKGYEVKHAGTYDIILNPTKYKIYTIIRRINRIIRK